MLSFNSVFQLDVQIVNSTSNILCGTDNLNHPYYIMAEKYNIAVFQSFLLYFCHVNKLPSPGKFRRHGQVLISLMKVSITFKSLIIVKRQSILCIPQDLKFTMDATGNCLVIWII